MEIQDIGLTDGSVTCKMVTYMAQNLYRKASFFSGSRLFSQAVRLYPVPLALPSGLPASLL